MKIIWESEINKNNLDLFLGKKILGGREGGIQDHKSLTNTK